MLAVLRLMNWPAPRVEMDIYRMADEIAYDSFLKKQPHIKPKLEPTNISAM